MSWNHRVLAHEHNKEIYLMIHEVYYNDDLKPIGYTERAVGIGGEDLKSIRWTLKHMRKCLEKPILWAGDKWPKEYKPK